MQALFKQHEFLGKCFVLRGIRVWNRPSRFFVAYVMHQTSWSVFWLLVGWLVVGGSGGVCLFYSNSFLPYRGVQEAGAMLFNIKSQFRYSVVVEESCTIS